MVLFEQKNEFVRCKTRKYNILNQEIGPIFSSFPVMNRNLLLVYE